ncbi:hypothetical protein [Micromonospora sp. NPDC003816]|uniref:hypothetical protein n=1 Tax=Micromonospora sp. NPDC003816 TaxID=3364224 RepID=UPI0036911157
MADEVGRQVVVRHLRVWVPGALRRARRATVVLGYDGRDPALAEEVVRVAGECAGDVRGARLTVLVLAGGTEELPARLGAAEAGLPTEVTVHLMPGPTALLPVALRACGASGAPVLSYLEVADAVDPVALCAAASGRPGEVLVPAGPGTPLRPALADAGFPLVAEVELPSGRRIGFGTASDRSLESFKESLWEAGGGRVDPAPLGRALLAELSRTGPRTVTELRRYAVTDTAYRAVDAVRALDALLDAGEVRRDPEQGRLGGDVVITAAAR